MGTQHGRELHGKEQYWSERGGIEVVAGGGGLQRTGSHSALNPLLIGLGMIICIVRSIVFLLLREKFESSWFDLNISRFSLY